MGEENGMNELDLSKAAEAGAREMLLHDYPEALDDVDKPGDPCNLGGYLNSFAAGLPAAVPDVLDAYAAKAEAEAAAARGRRFLPRMANGEMFPDMSEPARAARWLRAEAARLREGSNG